MIRSAAINLAALVVATWAAMLLVGQAHHHDVRVPAFGWGVLFPLVLAADIVATAIRVGNRR